MPSGAIQDFHLCGTICGTNYIRYCFYSVICGRRLHQRFRVIFCFTYKRTAVYESRCHFGHRSWIGEFRPMHTKPGRPCVRGVAPPLDADSASGPTRARTAGWIVSGHHMADGPPRRS